MSSANEVYLRNEKVLKGILKTQSDFFGQMNEREIESHLGLARTLLPEDLCKKSVYAAVLGENEFGTFEAIARNGMVASSPQALQEFSAANMLEIANRVDGSLHDGRKYLKGRPGTALIGCALLNGHISSGTCLKGFQPDGKRQGQFRPNSTLDCPNQRAGNCAERVLISWLPYIYAFLEDNYKGQQQHIFVRELIFDPQHLDSPTMVFTRDDPNIVNNNWETVRVTRRAETNGNQVENLITEVLPCPACSQAIVDKKIETVNILKLSRHWDGYFEKIDEDDVVSLMNMINHGVHVNNPGIKHKGIKARN
ncbi:hypothetical protein M1328_00905 [Patescibacteria group bacterium]|nr:hypothetical protein [Patescibacteria group bacterium]